MSARDWPLHFHCAHEGCTENVTYRYSTRRDLQDSYELKWYGGGKWKCLRHSQPEKVLSATNLETTYECTSEKKVHGIYFGGSGFISGPGFLIYANDLPLGTKLIVTARIELPGLASQPDTEKK